MSRRSGGIAGAKVSVLVIANCVAKGNYIFLEHVLYNKGALLAQLGLDPWQEAERLVQEAPPQGWPRSDENWLSLRSAASPSVFL